VSLRKIRNTTTAKDIVAKAVMQTRGALAHIGELQSGRIQIAKQTKRATTFAKREQKIGIRPAGLRFEVIGRAARRSTPRSCNCSNSGA
jgi:hypothetical protein